MNTTMATTRKQTIEMLQYLPDEELKTINSLVKMLIRAWDPDFTKVTEEEGKRIEEAENQIESGEYYTDEDVWN